MRKKLVAYFSASGTTKKIAEMIASAAEADLYEIKPKQPYSKADLNWMDKNSRSSVEMNDKKYRPEITDTDAHIDKYDEIILGFPIWWYVAPTIINTFLESYDFLGKKIVLFATSGGSGFGNTVSALKLSAEGAMIEEGEVFGKAAKQEIEAWVKHIYEDEAMRAHAKSMVFPIGQPNDAFAQYFVGQSYLAPISTSQVGIFNVTFEPGCRNNWHIHHAKSGGGQILVCVAGRGFYQEEGKEAVEMKPGDCVNVPAGVKHWHGAALNEWFSHLAIEVPGVDSANEWCEPVSEEEYNKLK